MQRSHTSMRISGDGVRARPRSCVASRCAASVAARSAPHRAALPRKLLHQHRSLDALRDMRACLAASRSIGVALRSERRIRPRMRLPRKIARSLRFVALRCLRRVMLGWLVRCGARSVARSALRARVGCPARRGQPVRAFAFAGQWPAARTAVARLASRPRSAQRSCVAGRLPYGAAARSAHAGAVRAEPNPRFAALRSLFAAARTVSARARARSSAPQRAAGPAPCSRPEAAELPIVSSIAHFSRLRAPAQPCPAPPAPRLAARAARPVGTSRPARGRCLEARAPRAPAPLFPVRSQTLLLKPAPPAAAHQARACSPHARAARCTRSPLLCSRAAHFLPPFLADFLADTGLATLPLLAGVFLAGVFFGVLALAGVLALGVDAALAALGAALAGGLKGAASAAGAAAAALGDAAATTSAAAAATVAFFAAAFLAAGDLAAAAPLAAAALPFEALPGAAPCGLLANNPMLLATLRPTKRHAQAG